MRAVRDDYLIPGRGQAWVRYIPHYEEKETKLPIDVQEVPRPYDGMPPELQFFNETGDPVLSELVQQDDEGGYFMPGEPERQVVYEEVRCEHIHWEDFLHNPAKNWEREVRWVAKRAYMTRAQLKQRFGKVGEKVELNYQMKGMEDYNSPDAMDTYKKAVVYETWGS